jgi:hypothetical protein
MKMVFHLKSLSTICVLTAHGLQECDCPYGDSRPHISESAMPWNQTYGIK